MRNPNRMNNAATVVERLKANPEALRHATVVGKWVWVEFADKPSKETREFLKAEGFHWNRTRNAWQHAGGVFRRKSSHDPRFAYGQVRVEDLAQAA